MKYLFIGLLSGITLSATAQRGENRQGSGNPPVSNPERGGDRFQPKNPLLNQSFWLNMPGVPEVKAAIEKGNNPLERNAMNMDPIVMAINTGAPNASILYLLNQPGCDPNAITHDGRTYLIWAASKGNTEVMEYLISKGARTNEKDQHGMSAINFAVANGVQNLKVYDLCLKGTDLKKDLNSAGANALLLAAGADTTFQLVEYFQSKGLDLKSRDSVGNTAFDYAARAGNIKIMNRLRQEGISYSPDVMVLAAQGTRRGSNTLETYQYLESIGAKPNITSGTGDNPLHYVARKPNQAAIIRYFISKGVKADAVNKEGYTPLMLAAGFSRDTATVETLLTDAKAINRKNTAGTTALALAVENNSADMIRYLLRKGADTRITDAKGANLVSYLFESYNPRQARDFEPKLALLKEQGFDITVNPADGNTLYHLAVSKNDLALLKRVQTYGIDVNAKNKEGLTALHKAAMMSKDDSMMQYLLSIGARKEAKTNFDETAYDLAHENEVLSKQNVSVEFLK